MNVRTAPNLNPNPPQVHGAQLRDVAGRVPRPLSRALPPPRHQGARRARAACCMLKPRAGAACAAAAAAACAPDAHMCLRVRSCKRSPPRSPPLPGVQLPPAGAGHDAHLQVGGGARAHALLLKCRAARRWARTLRRMLAHTLHNPGATLLLSKPSQRRELQPRDPLLGQQAAGAAQGAHQGPQPAGCAAAHWGHAPASRGALLAAALGAAHRRLFHFSTHDLKPRQRHPPER